MSACVACRNRKVALTRAEDDLSALARRMARRDTSRLKELLDKAKAHRDGQRASLQAHLAECEYAQHIDSAERN